MMNYPIINQYPLIMGEPMEHQTPREKLCALGLGYIFNASELHVVKDEHESNIMATQYYIGYDGQEYSEEKEDTMQAKTPRDQLRAAGLDILVESNPDYISSNAGYFAGSIRAYVDEIEYWANKGGPDMRRNILEYTKTITLIFAYQDQLRDEYEAKMVEAYDLCYMRGGD